VDAYGWRAEIPQSAVRFRKLVDGAVVKRRGAPGSSERLRLYRAKRGAESILEHV